MRKICQIFNVIESLAYFFISNIQKQAYFEHREITFLIKCTCANEFAVLH